MDYLNELRKRLINEGKIVPTSTGVGIDVRQVMKTSPSRIIHTLKKIRFWLKYRKPMPRIYICKKEETYQYPPTYIATNWQENIVAGEVTYEVDLERV
jgi:hypothetical protein